MTKLLIDRALLGRALEALEGGAQSWRLIGPAIEDLRAALAQDGQEPLSADTLARALVASRVIDPAAIDDPDGYDDGVMLERVRGLHRRLAALAQEEQAAVEIKPPNPEGATQCIVRWMVETPAGWVGAWDREALQQFVTPPSREPAQEEQEPCTYRCEAWPECVCVHLAKPAQEQEPWTDRELELIDGMIEVQLRHAAQCNVIANRPMAEKQRGWDMERVALLRKIRNAPPRREWKGLTEQRDELLEALKDAAEAFEILANGGSVDAHQAAQILRSDIAKAEGA